MKRIRVKYIEQDKEFVGRLLKAANGSNLNLISYVEILRTFAVFGRWEHWNRFAPIAPDYVDDTVMAMEYAMYRLKRKLEKPIIENELN